MKKIVLRLIQHICCILLLLVLHLVVYAQQPAFPGAEGFGKFATGGRTGTVYHVTNLNDAGPGSLRDAVSAPNRIVVFDVAGVIRISSRMVVSANIYLAGQTAPGEGITVYGNGWSFSNADNTICRYMKIRMGIVGESGKDAAGIAEGHDMIFDHCSVSWGRDETFSINATNAQNITIQNTIMSQGLLTHSAGGLIQTSGGVTLYRNLYADNGTRNNKIKGVNQYVNNIVYNWSAGAYIMGGDSQGESFANAVGNCFIQGPVDGVRPFSVGNALYHLYENDNLHDNDRNGAFSPYTIPQSEFGGGPDFQSSPYNYPALPTVAANTLLTNVLPTVGASLPYRDYVDYYVVNEVKSLGLKGTLIANEAVLPFGTPSAWSLWAGTARTDTDNDGMPDTWETANGLNPAINDAMIIASNGYANIENYINSITAANTQPYLRSPLALKQDSATQSSIYFSWLDYSEQEEGFVIERKVDGVFTEIGSTGPDENYFELSGLAPEEKDTFRVKAFNASGPSGYSNELIAKTKPVTVPVIDPTVFAPDITWTGSAGNTWDYSTASWVDGSNAAALFTDSSKLLFPESGSAGFAISIPAQVGAKDIVVNSGGDYSFSGAGFIAGTGSMNKTGAGKLSLLNNNIYTGATVLREGVLEINNLQNGGVASSIGASANYNFNWVWKGGKISYTGADASTDRSAVIDNTTEFSVENAANSVILNGVLSGAGGLTKSGPGLLVLRSANPYEGETVIKGGVLEVRPVNSSTEEGDIIHNATALGTSNILRLQGGTYRTTNGSTTLYENYPMHIYVEDGTVNGFEPYRNANLLCDVSGTGTLNYAITYSRELIQGDWSQFTGTLVANGIGTLTGAERSTLMFDNAVGMPNTRIMATGNTKIASYQNLQTLSLGGLSGNAGTSLSCGAKTSGGVITWAVGGAGTDETFNGVINNEAYGSTSNASGVTTIIKEGEGIWRLTGNNIYTGTTTVTGGSLIVNGYHSGGGKFFVTQGTLAGTGTLASEVEVSDTLQPGDNSIASFNINQQLLLLPSAVVDVEINSTSNTWDKINVGGNIYYDGTLKVALTGTVAAGDKFKIFNVADTVFGSITAIEPASPGAGLEWHFIPETGELIAAQPGFVNPPDSLELSATTTDLPVPGSTVEVTWRDNSNNETHFVLERSLDGVSYTDITHPAANATAYTDNGLTPSTKYFYRIKAVGASQESPYCVPDSVTTPALPTPPLQAYDPQPADDAQGIGQVNGEVVLKWKGSDNTEIFDVYFGTESGNLTKVGEVPYSAAPQYTATGIENNAAYYWRIDARNFKGTTAGNEWNFATANIPVAVAGDYRSAASGNWGSSTVTTGIWETFDGSSWIPAITDPAGVTPPAAPVVNTVTIRSGHTVTLNATSIVNNLVVENNAIIKSGAADGTGAAAVKTLRVSKNVFNYGTFGSSSTSAERISVEAYRDNDTVRLTGASRYNVNNFNVNSIAQTLVVEMDADFNINGFLRAFYSTATTTPWTGASQNDDNVTLTIQPGKTVTLGSSSYLHVGSTPTTNTITEYGNYTYSINGTLDMKATGTSCIVAHNTLNSATAINVNGTWLTGNAMRLVNSATTVPVGSMAVNVGSNGLLDAGARYSGSTATTNLVVTNATTTQTIFFNLTGNGALRNRVATSDVTFAIGAEGFYSPVKISNSGTAGMVSVGVKNVFSHPPANPNIVVNKEYNIEPAAGDVVLNISLGWLTGQQAAGFNPAGSLVLGHYGTSGWDETAAALISGSGTMASPYYAKASGFTSFSPFAVANTTGLSGAVLPLKLLSFTATPENKTVKLRWKTASEINLQRFEVERSEDALQFTALSSVNAMNTNGTHSYEYTDIFPSEKAIAYYRLKMIDTDGSYTYSPVEKVRRNIKDNISVFPNPAKDIITVSYAALAEPATLSILAMDGKIVQQYRLAEGSSQLKADITTLAKGYYIISIAGEQTTAVRLLKQ
ncbi:MAG: autotransporter-associated beta strand repeat-containing protein [Ferruginibacter sp.]